MARAVAFLFPGQGSQFPGMGQDLLDEFEESREVFVAADRALGRPLSRLCFEGTPEQLALTENTQPAILTVSVAAFRVLESRGLRPIAAAGHSLGEYSAHVAAGTLGFADAVRAVELRGRFMQEAVPPGRGAMAAILGLPADRVAQICESAAEDGVVSRANLNGPAQVVIAGDRAAVGRAMHSAGVAGARKVVPLQVSAPFHCSLMAPAKVRLGPVLERMAFADPCVPVYSNVDALPVTEGAAARSALLRQVTASVRWQESIEAMLEAGIEAFVEVGPGRVLAGLVRGIRKGVPTFRGGTAAGVREALEALAA